MPKDCSLHHLKLIKFNLNLAWWESHNTWWESHNTWCESHNTWLRKLDILTGLLSMDSKGQVDRFHRRTEAHSLGAFLH